MNILEHRKWVIDGNWHEAKRFLRNFKSVMSVEYLEQSSSAGDWSGYFVQKVGKGVRYIFFWQTNNFPRNGFTLCTGPAMVKEEFVAKIAAVFTVK